MTEFITDEDRETLREMSEATDVNSVFNQHDRSKRSDEVDPLDLAPNWEMHRGKINENLSREIVEQAKEKGFRQTARDLNVSLRTVQRHVNGDIKFEEVTYITPGLCGAMRSMAHDGFTLREIADRFDSHFTTVRSHVSSTAGQPCSHDVNIPRKEYE